MQITKVNEPIQVCDTRFNFFPKTFLWRGQTHYVRSVDCCWTMTRKHLFNRAKRHCFRVRTADAVYDLHQDLAQNQWYLDRMIVSGA